MSYNYKTEYDWILNEVEGVKHEIEEGLKPNYKGLKDRLRRVTGTEPRLLKLLRQNQQENYFNSNTIAILKKLFLREARENWSIQAKIDSPIIPLERQKIIIHSNGEQAERRQYMGISPICNYQFDGPSIATALTPSNSIQPFHHHQLGEENNFVDGDTELVYQTAAGLQIVEASRGDMVFVQPKLSHSLRNPTSTHILNLTVKPINASEDRFVDSTYSLEGIGGRKTPKSIRFGREYHIVNPGIIEYKISYQVLDYGQNVEFCCNNGSLTYILDGTFISQKIRVNSIYMNKGDMFFASKEFDRAVLQCQSPQGRIYNATII